MDLTALIDAVPSQFKQKLIAEYKNLDMIYLCPKL